jgi:membrane fusion protein (multidrug efflux system)
MSSTLSRETHVPQVRTGARHRSNKRVALAGIALAVLAGAAWYGNDWWTRGRFIQSTDDSYVGGNVTAIAPHVGGFVESVLVSDNQHVTAGQLLIRLDQRDFRAADDHAEAIVNARLATLGSLHAQYAKQQSVIAQQEAELVAKDAQASFATEDAARYRSLALTAAGSRQDAQRTTALDQAARSAVAAATAGLTAAHQQLDVLGAEIAEAAANITQAQADAATARLNLGWTEIRSPIDGYVGNRAAQIGAYTTVGTALLAITPAHGLWVDANFKEDQLARMRPGQRASFVADVLPGHIFSGQILSLAPATGAIFSVIPPENATGNFTKIVQRVPVRIALDDGAASLGELRPGLSTTVSVDTRPASTLTSPASGRGSAREQE